MACGKRLMLSCWETLMQLACAICCRAVGVSSRFWFCLLEKSRHWKANAMGKWAQYSKRGSAAQTGFLAAPVDADWSIGTLTATTAPINRLSNIPAPADRWGILVIKVADGTVAFSNFAAGTPITATGLTTATQYRVLIAWYQSPSFARVSDWSPPRTFTTP